MPTNQPSQFSQYLRRAALLRDGAGLTDGQLLEDFISRCDEAALAALVQRHGTMVWGVCRRLLPNYHDAEDAFQATFLVLVRKAASIVPREMIANWLYGVARQTALKARATAAKRKEREIQVAEMPEPIAAEQELWRDLQPLLDEELSRLPAKYRAVIVLCDLEAMTRQEAARHLGVPEGTVAGWLARARAMLAKRLARHGPAVSGAVLAAVLWKGAASACVPTSVVSSTIEAASLFAAGQAAAARVISARVAALAQGVLKAMLLSKIKVATAVLLGVLACIGGGAVAFLPAAAGPLGAQANGQKGAPEKKKSDKDKFQGKWVPVSLVNKGQKIDINENVAREFAGTFGFWKLAFDGDKVTPGDGDPVPYTLTPSKNPKAIDIKIGGEVGTPLKAIYEFEDDRLKLAVKSPPGKDAERPSDFDDGTNNGFVIVFEKKE
jgi:RNA polymerase sigma factor (sigma-70 family)